MLLYITAEDVLGDDRAPQRRPAPSHAVLPETLGLLYDAAMRHHARPHGLVWPGAGEAERVPDWRLDRLVIRIALYCRERLGLEPGSRAAVFGELGWLWPVAELAVLGFGAASVGLEHDIPDDALAAALRAALPKVIFATDAASTARLRELRAQGRLPQAGLVGTGAPDTGELLPVARLLDMGGTLDTPERAQAFRMTCRRTAPLQSALWHAGSRPTSHLTHRSAMERVAALLRTRQPAAGDVAWVQAPRVTLGTRLALLAAIGDGLTTTVLGGAAGAGAELARVRPSGLRAEAAWLERACDGCAPSFPLGLARRAARRRLQQRLGDRLRWVETERPLAGSAAAALAAAGTRLFVDEDGGADA